MKILCHFFTVPDTLQDFEEYSSKPGKTEKNESGTDTKTKSDAKFKSTKAKVGTCVFSISWKFGRKCMQ